MVSEAHVPVPQESGWPQDIGQDLPESAGTILVVEDAPANLHLLAEMLKVHSFVVATAQDGLSALALAQELLPDVILLDIKMPDMDGFEVCRQLKAIAQTRDIPVIFISALHEIFDKVHAFQVGAVDYVTKPFQVDEILVRVETHLHLRRLHAHLVAKNQVLTEALAQLQATQQQLIEAEKLAALGNLVAGIAHEINTPIGIGVTAASTLADETALIQQQYTRGELTRAAFAHYAQTASHSSHLILHNLQRAADLIQSLKQVSADQLYLERRPFLFDAYLQEILCSLTPTLKHTPHCIVVDGNAEVKLDSYPGALSQIVTNLVFNSMKHGYPTGQPGTFRLTWHQVRETLHFRYADDGCGIAAPYLSRIFDPFFTTARGNGGTGLGLHIVYTLVTKKMGGKIRCESSETGGTVFIMELPVNAPSEYADDPNVYSAATLP
jgi:signal transduction histidine kinase